MEFDSFQKYLFIWQYLVLVALCGVFAASCGIFPLQCMKSLVVAHRLSCFEVCGILVPQSGIKPASPVLEGGFLTAGPQGKSLEILCDSDVIPSFSSLRDKRNFVKHG